MSAATATLFGVSAIPEIPGRAVLLFEHRAVVECSAFSKRVANQMHSALSACVPWRPWVMRQPSMTQRFWAARVELSAALRLVGPAAGSLARSCELGTTEPA